MDINQNQQINTFLKGMNTDTSDMLLSSDLYRFAENVRIVTDTDSNSGELHLIEGTVKDCEINKQILAVNSIRDITVFIVKDKDVQELGEYVPGSWYIYKKVGNDNPTQIFGPCNEPLWNTDSSADIRKSITTVLRYESAKNIKLYIADSTKKHSVLVVNIANTYTEEQSLFDYMFANQRSLLSPPEVEISAQSGKIQSGKVLYAYCLYSKNGASTPLSILSKALSLYKNEFSGYEAEKQSGRAVEITIPNISNVNLDHVRIYRISYQISGELPKISLVKDLKFSSTVVDNGTNVIEDVALSEFLQQFTPFIYPTQIESKGDYLFAANMKYSQDVADDLFKNFDARSYSRGNYIVENENTESETHVDILTENSINVEDVPQEKLRHWTFNKRDYEYLEDDWHGFVLNLLGGISDYYYEDWEDAINGYGKCICWRYKYQNIRPDNYNRAPISSNQTGGITNSNSTFRCGEIYRFGVRLFDKYGRASSVKWIADIMIPIGANMSYDTEQGETVFRNVGIEFFKTPESDEYWENVAGWEIVRCDRTLEDRKVITQGIVGIPVQLYSWPAGTDGTITLSEHQTNMLCTPGFFSTDIFGMSGGNAVIGEMKYAQSYNPVLMFSSPEYCYLSDDIESLLRSFKSLIYLTNVYKCYPESDKVSWTKLWEDNVYYSLDFAITKVTQTSKIPYPFLKKVDGVALPASNWVYSYDGDEYKGVVSTDANSTTLLYLNYFRPDYSKFIDISTSKYKIDDVAFVNSPKYSDFANQEVLIYKNNVSSIGDKTFVNWSVPLLLDLNGEHESRFKALADNIEDDWAGDDTYNYNSAIRSLFYYPIGSGGKMILLKLAAEPTLTETDNTEYAPSITVVNINKEGVIPYGGYNKTAIDNSSYISLGDYKQCSTNNNNILVFSGDTKIRAFVYNALHNWYDSTYKNLRKMGTVYSIPVETDIDILALYGWLYGVDNKWDHRIQDEPASFDTYTQDTSAYLYNTAYNATPDIISWTTQELSNLAFDDFDVRIHYSNVKINNEDVDSWAQFAAANYIDVDSRFGEITDLKLFKDKLIFWLENATGILSVNERVVLNDLNDTQVVLGTGGVLERYDYFSTIYGQKKNQHARTTSNTSLYWWDGNNKELLVYLQKYDISPISSIKNIKNYINERNENPIPSISYDNKHNEVIASVVGEDESIIYSEQIDAFTAVYKFSPLFDFVTNGKLSLTSLDTIYRYNECENNESKLFKNKIYPYIKYVVNKDPQYVKTFDMQTFGGRFYGGEMANLTNLYFDYYTPLKQHSSMRGGENVIDNRRMTNLEYDFRLNIPRDGATFNNKKDSFNNKKDYGNRMRGKTMQCELKSTTSNSTDFSLQYVITKFRTSWT